MLSLFSIHYILKVSNKVYLAKNKLLILFAKFINNLLLRFFFSSGFMPTKVFRLGLYFRISNLS